MKPLILTGRLWPDFLKNDFADLALDLAFFDFIWGPQPSPDELAAHLGPRAASHSHDRATHWSDWGGSQWETQQEQEAPGSQPG